MCDTESFENPMKQNQENPNTKKYQNHVTKTNVGKRAIKMARPKPNLPPYDNLLFAQFSWTEI